MESLKTRKIKLDGETFTVVPVFPRRSNLRGIPLLRRVRELVLAEPKRLNMGIPQVRPDDDQNSRAFAHVGASWYEKDYVTEFPPCNTVGCVAGWGDAVVFGGTALDIDRRGWSEVEQRATVFFQFEEYGIRGAELYFVENWPEDLADRYATAEKVKDHQGMADATAERIDRIIAEMKEAGAEG